MKRWFLVLCFLFFSSLVRAQPTDNLFALDNIMNASVEVTGTEYRHACINTDPIKECSGSGVVIKYNKATNKTYILTNYHVLERTLISKCKVYIVFRNYFAGSQTGIWIVEAKIIKYSPRLDLGILEVNQYIAEPVKISKKSPSLNELIYNFSNSDCIPNYLSTGNVINLNDSAIGIKSYGLNFKILGGASGSGVFNFDNELIGLIYAKNNVLKMSYMLKLHNIKVFLKDFI